MTDKISAILDRVLISNIGYSMLASVGTLSKCKLCTLWDSLGTQSKIWGFLAGIFPR